MNIILDMWIYICYIGHVILVYNKRTKIRIQFPNLIQIIWLYIE